jgi:hypothetical protein
VFIPTSFCASLPTAAGPEEKATKFRWSPESALITAGTYAQCPAGEYKPYKGEEAVCVASFPMVALWMALMCSEGVVVTK